MIPKPLSTYIPSLYLPNQSPILRLIHLLTTTTKVVDEDQVAFGSPLVRLEEKQS